MKVTKCKSVIYFHIQSYVSIRVYGLYDKNPLIYLTTFLNSLILNLKNLCCFFLGGYLYHTKIMMFFSLFFPIFTTFLFHFILTKSSRTVFKSDGVSSLLSFVPDLRENRDSMLNIMFHVAFCYTDILCYLRLLGAWIQIVSWWSKMISISWLYMVHQFWIVSGES